MTESRKEAVPKALEEDGPGDFSFPGPPPARRRSLDSERASGHGQAETERQGCPLLGSRGPRSSRTSRRSMTGASNGPAGSASIGMRCECRWRPSASRRPLAQVQKQGSGRRSLPWSAHRGMAARGRHGPWPIRPERTTALDAVNDGGARTPQPHPTRRAIDISCVTPRSPTMRRTSL